MNITQDMPLQWDETRVLVKPASETKVKQERP